MKISRLLPFLGLILFAFVLSRIDLSATLDTVLSADPFLIALTLTLHIPAIMIKSGKWLILVRRFSNKVTWMRAMSYWIIGFLIGIVTPGRVGDFSKAYYIKEYVSFGKGMTTVIIDRIIDMLVLFSLAILGGLFLSSYMATSGHSYIMLIFITLFIAFLAGTFMLTRKSLVMSITRPLFQRLLPGKLKPRLRLSFNEFYKGIGLMKKNKTPLVLSAILSYNAIFLVILQHYLLALSLGLEISFLFMAAVVPITMLLDTLPVSVSGVGTRDIALIIFLGFISISPENAVSLSLIILFTNYLFLAVIGAILWIRNPIKLEGFRQ